MKSFVVRHNDIQELRQLLTYKGGVETVQFDFSPWSDSNGNVSAATWTLESGNAAISGAALASNVASAQITTSSVGSSVISVSATGTNNTKKVYFRVYAKDPQQAVNDYGICLG